MSLVLNIPGFNQEPKFERVKKCLNILLRQQTDARTKLRLFNEIEQLDNELLTSIKCQFTNRCLKELRQKLDSFKPGRDPLLIPLLRELRLAETYQNIVIVQDKLRAAVQQLQDENQNLDRLILIIGDVVNLPVEVNPDQIKKEIETVAQTEWWESKKMLAVSVIEHMSKMVTLESMLELVKTIYSSNPSSVEPSAPLLLPSS